MRSFNKYIIPALLLATSLAGCSKGFLNQHPSTAVSSPDAMKTPADMQAALTGTYSQLLAIYGQPLTALGDLLGDNVFVSVANIGIFIQENGYTFTANGAYSNSIWPNAYQAILGANNIIDAPLRGSKVIDQYRGEAYAIRALAYFDLVRLYAKAYTVDSAALGIPIALHYDPHALPTRNSVAEVYRQIAADLDSATNLMTIYNGTGSLSKYAALALYAKVELYRGKNQSAYDKAKQVIDGSGFSLLTMDAVADYWAAVQPQDNTSKVETLFEVVSDAVNYSPYGELAFDYVQDDNSSGDLLTRKSLYDMYGADDVRKDLILVGKRLSLGGEDPAWIVNKYATISGDFNDKKVIRMSDVYLIAAETAYRLGKTNESLDYLNTLMAQRDPTLTYASSGDQLLTDIITERRKELAFEGDRFFDLNRLNLDIQRTPEYSSGDIKAGDPRRIMPIPESETNANPNIEQNQGYSTH